MSLLRRLRDHPYLLEAVYRFTLAVVQRLDPFMKRVGYRRSNVVFRIPERLVKQAVFDCKMCGQCALHFTGMTCPMGCPKNLRNGPCGGVRADMTCEVDPAMKCVWIEAYERSRKMKFYGNDIFEIRPPLNHRLTGSSAFINILSLQGDDMPAVWQTQTGLTHDDE